MYVHNLNERRSREVFAYLQTIPNNRHARFPEGTTWESLPLESKKAIYEIVKNFEQLLLRYHRGRSMQDQFDKWLAEDPIFKAYAYHSDREYTVHYEEKQAAEAAERVRTTLLLVALLIWAVIGVGVGIASLRFHNISLFG